MSRAAWACTDQRGTVTVEYVIVLSLLSVGACAAVSVLAVMLMRLFAFQHALIALPFP